jgi:hypothetical protein
MPEQKLQIGFCVVPISRDKSRTFGLGLLQVSSLFGKSIGANTLF